MPKMSDTRRKRIQVRRRNVKNATSRVVKAAKRKSRLKAKVA